MPGWTAKHRGYRSQEKVREGAMLAEADFKQPIEVLAVLLTSTATGSEELMLTWHCGTKGSKKHPPMMIRITVTSRFSVLEVGR